MNRQCDVHAGHVLRYEGARSEGDLHEQLQLQSAHGYADHRSNGQFTATLTATGSGDLPIAVTVDDGGTADMSLHVKEVTLGITNVTGGGEFVSGKSTTATFYGADVGGRGAVHIHVHSVPSDLEFGYGGQQSQQGGDGLP